MDDFLGSSQLGEPSDIESSGRSALGASGRGLLEASGRGMIDVSGRNLMDVSGRTMDAPGRKMDVDRLETVGQPLGQIQDECRKVNTPTPIAFYLKIAAAVVAVLFLAVLIFGFFYSGGKASQANQVAVGPPGFVDIADIEHGFSFVHYDTRLDVLQEVYRNFDNITFAEVLNQPQSPAGSPDVVLFDFDQDGDLDIYATNSFMGNNGLFENLGNEKFKDVAVCAGVSLLGHDSTGACTGDLDNDGYPDLYVLGLNEENFLFQNNGDGTFTEKWFNLADKSSMACSFGDIDGDGLLDIVVGNNFDMSTQQAIHNVCFDLNQHNNLYKNMGGFIFDDVSNSSGILQNVSFVTWATAMMDIDQDGDIDIMFADDNAATLPTAFGGDCDRGFNHLYLNDGSGSFTLSTSLLDYLGDWMGITTADLNGDGNLDLYATNVGDYLVIPAPLGSYATRHFLQDSMGNFADPGVGPLLGSSVFGWDISVLDVENDGDQDIIYVGGLQASIGIDFSNPGALLINDGNAVFSLADDPWLVTNHSLRCEHGMAMGDLNGDALPDVVAISNFVANEDVPLIHYAPFGEIFDSVAWEQPMFHQIGADDWVWSGFETNHGLLSVEINHSPTNNNFVKVKLLGTVGLLDHGRTNRQGMGAVVTRENLNGKWNILPMEGSSASQGQELMFGLGTETSADLDVLWTGGGHTIFCNIAHGNTILIPEIPCDPNLSHGQWTQCKVKAIKKLIRLGHLDHPLGFYNSRIKQTTC